MNFGKTFLAALLAILVANIIAGIFAVMIFAGMVASVGSFGTGIPAYAGPNSVLRIDFTNGVTDEPDYSPFHSSGLTGLAFNNSNSLMDVLGAIDNAVYDPNIKGIYINVTGGSVSMANVEEIRAALQKFRENSGKFVIAYAEVYSQLGYYLSSVADRVFIHPEGGLSWQGLASQVMFYKGTLEKLGVEVEILRHGTFKSAVEPFMLDRMSPENRMQLNTVLGSIWGMILDDIAASREIHPDALSYYANNLMIDTPAAAVEHGIVDAVLYEDQVMELLGRLVASGASAVDSELQEVLAAEDWSREYTVDELVEIANGVGEDEEMAEDVTRVEEPAAPSARQTVTHTTTIINLSDYISTLVQNPLTLRGDRIAVVYIDGDIVDGPGVAGSVGGATIAEKLSRVRTDNRVKGVVVRVNSPGGSALASDVMWREMELLRREKLLVVSMGGYAASGGYYVSCPADLIITDRSTLTGSIGVFGLLPNAGKALKDKLGITTDVAKTNDHADMGSIFRPLDATERDYMQRSVEQVYATFIGHVAAGRNLTTGRVDEIGGGRVWSGANAVEIGLADGIGGLYDAIELCADRAGVSGSYRIYEVVDQPDALTALIRSFATGVRADKVVRDELGDLFLQYRSLRNMLEGGGVQARMPYEIEIR